MRNTILQRIKSFLNVKKINLKWCAFANKVKKKKSLKNTLNKIGPSIGPLGNTWDDIYNVTLSTIYFDTLLPVFQMWVDVVYSTSIETISTKFSHE